MTWRMREQEWCTSFRSADDDLIKHKMMAASQNRTYILLLDLFFKVEIFWFDSKLDQNLPDHAEMHCHAKTSGKHFQQIKASTLVYVMHCDCETRSDVEIETPRTFSFSSSEKSENDEFLLALHNRHEKNNQQSARSHWSEDHVSIPSLIQAVATSHPTTTTAAQTNRHHQSTDYQHQEQQQNSSSSSHISPSPAPPKM